MAKESAWPIPSRPSLRSNTRRNYMRWILAATTVIAVLFGACGDDDDAGTVTRSASQSPTPTQGASPISTQSEPSPCANTGQTMFKVDLSTGDVVTIGHGSFPVWSPDGGFIAYLVVPGQSGPNCNEGLVLQRADSLEPLFVLPRVATQYRWSPTQNVIAAGGNGFADDYVTLIAGLDDAKITSAQLYHGRVGAITWSPDGQRLAFADEETANILVYELASQRLTEISSPVQATPRAVAEIAFSADSKRLAFVSYHYGQAGPNILRLFVASLPDGRIQELPAAGGLLGLHWTNDGSHILFWDDAARTILSAAADGSGEPEAIAENAGGLIPSPDGTRIAFVDDPCGQVKIATIATDGSDRNVVSEGGHLARQALIWSPTGNQLAFSSDATYTIESDGTGKRRVADQMEGLAWSPDGRFLLGQELAGIDGSGCGY